MAMPPTPEQQIRFLLNIQRLLEEDNFVSTYKHALLLSIADSCVEFGDDTGGPLRLSTDQLAEKMISYYWRQAVPYQTLDHTHLFTVIKQNTGKQAAILSIVSRAREQHGSSLTQLTRNPEVWKPLKQSVAKTIRIMPLWKLQTVGRRKLEFLYAHDESEGHEIILKEGVCFCFRRFHGLIHELVRGAWLRFVRSISENRLMLGEASDLSDFMFGSSRAPLELYRPILVQYQAGNCFYCQQRLGQQADVDHFIPWSRYPVDFGHNFVLAHKSCNNMKADRLAAVEHLHRWCNRNAQHGNAMSDAFQKQNIVHNQNASLRVTTWAYEQAQQAGSLLWKRSNELAPISQAWRSACPPPEGPN
jgi:hypothetical protein